MKFWSNLENEYNEIQGENQEKGDEGNSKEPDDSGGKPDGETAFQDMLSEFNSDLKTIPKGDLFPSLTSGKRKEGKSELVEESEFDVGDARRALKSEESTRKHDKKCKIGDKTYEIGERWIDENTGKEMICILMNIPKEVQPTLAEADVTLTVDEPDPVTAEEEWKIPSVEPEWSYTAHPTKKSRQDASKCKSEDEENKTLDTESKENDKTETAEKEDEKKEELETIKIKPSKKLRKEKPTPKTTAKNKGLKTQNKKINRGKHEDKPQDGDKYDTETDTENENHDKRNENHDKRARKSKEKNKKLTSKIISGKELSKEVPKAEPNKIDSIETNAKQKDEEPATGTTSDNEALKDNQSSKIKKEEATEGALTRQAPAKTNADEGDEAKESAEQPEIKGEPIFMKETIVKRRKLLRTEETIQTTTTDKTTPSK